MHNNNFLKSTDGRVVNTEIIRSSDNRTSDLSKGRFQGIKEADTKGTRAFQFNQKRENFKNIYRENLKIYSFI